MGLLDKFNDGTDKVLGGTEDAARGILSAIRSVLVWTIVLIAPILIGAFVGESLPGWAAPVYGLIVAWLVVAFSGNSRYRYLFGLLAFGLSWASCYIHVLDISWR